MQQMSKWHELEDDASRAAIIVQKLTSRKEELRESLPRGMEPMPRMCVCVCVCVWRGHTHMPLDSRAASSYL